MQWNHSVQKHSCVWVTEWNTYKRKRTGRCSVDTITEQYWFRVTFHSSFSSESGYERERERLTSSFDGERVEDEDGEREKDAEKWF